MKRFKNGGLIPIVGLIGLLLVIGVVLFSHAAYQKPPEGYTPQEIGAMGVEPIDINAASAEELGELSALSQKQIESIIAYREENGGFQSIDELTKVEGIGKTTLEKIAPYLTTE
ncbi:MAG: helix-hairpin-helix domain-containing protein [Ruminococcus sp.]|nr:helix-hairpin-helix domain-containing protein [Ruminococcus sp.]